MKTGMHPFWGGVGGLHAYCLSVPVCGEWGGGCDYDLNIESNINLAGDAIIKIYIIDY